MRAACDNIDCLVTNVVVEYVTQNLNESQSGSNFNILGCSTVHGDIFHIFFGRDVSKLPQLLLHFHKFIHAQIFKKNH